jgi:preprotein translocase subunit SecF
LFGVVLVGTYTSIFIAAPLLIYFGVGSFRGTIEDEPEPAPAPAKARAAAEAAAKRA